MCRLCNAFAVLLCKSNVLLQFNFTEVKLLEQNKKPLPVIQTSYCMCIKYRVIVLYIYSLNIKGLLIIWHIIDDF